MKQTKAAIKALLATITTIGLVVGLILLVSTNPYLFLDLVIGFLTIFLSSVVYMNFYRFFKN